MSQSSSRMPDAPPPGLRVGGYRLLTRIGEGGMGVVHLAQRPGGDRVALKVLRPHIIGDEEARRRLAREVESLQLIKSRWVAEIVDADPWGDIPYVATRYVPGLSLSAHIRDEGPVVGDDLRYLAASLAHGLADVHSYGVLHRDVKPSNVLLEGRAPILIDFGLARVADDPRLTHTGWLLGTPGYLAPELLYGEDATRASDVHAWAATVAFAALGRPPFGTGPSIAIMDRVRRGEHQLSGLPGWLRPLLEEAMHPDALWRPTLSEISDRLREESSPRLAVVEGVTDVSAEEPEEPVEPDWTVPFPVAVRAPAPAPEPVPDFAPRMTPPVGPVPGRVTADDELTEVIDHATTPQPVDPWRHPAPPAVAANLHQVAYQPASGSAFPASAWEPEPAKLTWAQRIRQGVPLAGLAVIGGAGIAAAPYRGTLAVLVVAWLLRTGSLAHSAMRERRDLRGARRWYDGALMVLSTPWELVRSVPGTMLLCLWALGLATAGGLLGYAFSLGLSLSLLVAGSLFSAGMLVGPGGRRVRGPIATLTAPLSHAWLRIGVTVLVLLVLTIVLLILGSDGPNWAPGTDQPFAGLSLSSVRR